MVALVTPSLPRGQCLGALCASQHRATWSPCKRDLNVIFVLFYFCIWRAESICASATPRGSGCFEMDLLFSCVVLCLSLLAFTATEPAEYDGIVRPTSDGRYEAYMIPPYKSNHASFLELLPSGELLMAWFSGKAEGANNCSIVLARLPANSMHWSKASLISRREGYSNQNPVLFFDVGSNSLYLFHSQQPAEDSAGTFLTSAEAKAHIWMLHSEDGSGMTWTAPQLVFGRDGSFDRNRIILSLTNEWIYPIYFACKLNYL